MNFYVNYDEEYYNIKYSKAPTKKQRHVNCTTILIP